MGKSNSQIAKEIKDYYEKRMRAYKKVLKIAQPKKSYPQPKPSIKKWLKNSTFVIKLPNL